MTLGKRKGEKAKTLEKNCNILKFNIEKNGKFFKSIRKINNIN